MIEIAFRLPGVDDNVSVRHWRADYRILPVTGRRHGFPTQALGEDAVFGVRFLENERPKNWIDLQAHDRALGLQWGVELLKRGLLINPNEKFYISVAHTDEDVDRTLEICDHAFKACRR